MIKLLKNANVYAPEPLGNKDILIVGEKICRIQEDLRIYENLPDVEVYDLEGRYIVPGYIDLHVHITGGGGEKGRSFQSAGITVISISYERSYDSSRSSWYGWDYEKCGKSCGKGKGFDRRRDYSLCIDKFLWISACDDYRKCRKGHHDDSADYRSQDGGI